MRFFQPESTENLCRPRHQVSVQYQVAQGGAWTTMISKEWGAGNDGWNDFVVGDVRNWRVLTEVLLACGLAVCAPGLWLPPPAAHACSCIAALFVAPWPSFICVPTGVAKCASAGPRAGTWRARQGAARWAEMGQGHWHAAALQHRTLPRLVVCSGQVLQCVPHGAWLPF